MDSKSKKFPGRSALLAVAALVVGAGARLYFADSFYGNFDQTSFEIVARIMRREGNVFAETERYNYSPIWSYCLLVLNHVAETSGLQFHFVVRAFGTVVDVADALVVGLLSARLGYGKKALPSRSCS